MGSTVESHHQSGGITAGSVTLNVIPDERRGPDGIRKIGWKTLAGAITLAASIATVLGYLGFSPWSGQMAKKHVNVTSYNQSGGITAGEIHVGEQARHITPEVASQLYQHLPKDKKVSIAAVMGDQEAFRFANEVKDYLSSKGYTVDGVSQSIYSRPVVGQIINRNDDGGFDIIIGARG